MTKRTLVTIPLITLALFAGTFASTPAAAAALCEFESIAILGINSVHISRDATVSGDVIGNSESPGPVLNDGAEVALDKGSTVNGAVKGHTVDLDRQATINGAVTFVELNNEGTINGTPTIGSPPYTDLPDFQTAAPGADDVFAGPGQTVILGDEGFCSVTSATACVIDTDCPATETCERAPVTAYDDIQLAGGTVVFSGGGSFDVASISGTGSVEFDAPTELRVSGRIDTEANSSVGPAAGSGISASDIVIYVSGANGGAGGPLDTPFAVNLGQSGTVEANVYAPNGTIEIDKNSIARGAFIALDVEIQRGTQVFKDSAFVNEAPTAVAQEVLTDGSSDLVITLEGSDPEGADLSFSIEVGPAPAAGSIVSGPTAITPSAVNQCSQSGASCSVDADCPFFAGGETCESVTPPITQATVTYRPTAANCLTNPESGEVECPADFFTFGVTDDCGALGTAIVSVNGGTSEMPGDPGTGVDEVVANDKEIDAIVNQVRSITLSAAAPDTVASLTYRVETLPTGALQDSLGAAVVAGADLPSPVLTYQAPATAGADSFIFSARDSTTSTPPCGPPSCDTGTVNISVGEPPELAPDQSVGTNLNTPVEITLFANEGGTGDGGALAPVQGSALQLTSGNGAPLTREQWSRLARRRPVDSDARGVVIGGATLAGPTALGVGDGWGGTVGQFGWCDVVTSPDCDDLVALVNVVEVIESPFNFTTTEPSCLRVTDTLAKGDHWRVEATFGGNADWTDFTSEVDQSTVGTTGDPDVAFGDLSYSHGEFDLVGNGAYSVRLFTIPPDSFAFGTAGYIRVDAGPCVDIVWTITSLPASGTLTNLNGSVVQIGDTYNTTPTVVYTPAFNVSGTDAFGYNVTQGSTLGQNVVVDSAIVGLLINPNDPCILVGRPAGCSPGGGSFQGPVSSPAPAAPDEALAGPGVAVSIVGEGDVTSSRPVIDGVVQRGMICGAGLCRANFAEGSEVTLWARALEGRSRFVEWGGDCSGSDHMIVVIARRDAACTAVFERVDPE